MKGVASTGLCEKLYELSGWGRVVYGDELDQTYSWWCWIEAHQEYEVDNGAPRFPAYDAGYLLRKLPPGKDLRHVSPKSGKTYWAANYIPDEWYYATADTPEDVLCKLAIELHKAGVLTKEGGDE